MRKLILATLATVALGSAALAQTAPRPDFPGAKQADPADPAYLGVGTDKSKTMGMTAGGSKPSKEELAKHKAYVESLRHQH
jgi:opacity protein-like surface antigen